jgi:hypothetical protein
MHSNYFVLQRCTGSEGDERAARMSLAEKTIIASTACIQKSEN